MARCSGITSKGKRCARKAQEQLNGFCKTHFPTTTKKKTWENVKKIAKVGGGLIAAASGIIKIIEFVAQHLQSINGIMFGGKGFDEDQLKDLRQSTHLRLIAIISHFGGGESSVDCIRALQLYESCARITERPPDQLSPSGRRLLEYYCTELRAYPLPMQELPKTKLIQTFAQWYLELPSVLRETPEVRVLARQVLQGGA